MINQCVADSTELKCQLVPQLLSLVVVTWNLKTNDQNPFEIRTQLWNLHRNKIIGQKLGGHLTL